MKTFYLLTNLWQRTAAVMYLMLTVGVGLMLADTDASVTISTYATSNSWTNSTRYTSVTIDSYITATASYTSGNSGKYYSTSPGTWRFYQNGGGKLVLTAASGYKIKSFKITFDVSNNGTLTYYGTALASGTAITDLNNGRIELTVGATSGSTGSVLVSKIEVTYAASAISPIEYTLVTDATTLTAGDVVVLGYGDNKTAGPARGAFLTANEATISDGVLTSDEALEFTLGGSVGAWTLNNGTNSLRATSSTNLSLASSGGTATWTIAIASSSPNAATITNTGYSGSVIYYNTSSPRFKNYTSTQAAIQLYRKEIDCDKFVDVTGGTSSSNATFNSSSPSSVPTCSSTASDRNFTISITTSTGYEVTSSSNITFTKTSGTATASYVSGPSGSYPNYSYTYRFAQDDNGAGKIDITASAKTYEITLDREDGTTGSTSVTMTYNSSSHTAITNPTKTGFTFGGYWTGDNGTGTLVIATDGTLQANVTNYTGAGGIWTKDATCTLYAKWTAKTYEDYVFSCAELTLEAHLVTSGTPIFITSTANKKVRSQDYIQITGSGLTPSTALTFPGLNSKFEIKTSTGGTISTDASGDIDVAAYIFYTPGAGDTSDGLDKMTGISVSVSGAKQKSVNLTQDIIGRHLPEDFVIAGKKNGKWYALPANMASTDHPSPAEIAVDDANDPSIAYTATSNIYGLEGPASGNISDGNGQYVKLTMSPLSDAPLFGQAPSNTAIGKSGDAIATNKLSEGWWWKLQQENTSITNPQDAKYKIYCVNNTSSLSIKNEPFQWGLYASGVEELRLIPASSVEYTEAEVVAWGQKKLILEIEKPALATQARAKIGDSSWSGNKSLATTTGTSVKGTATQYNYTLDFTSDAFDFSNAANEGKMLIIELLNSGGTPLKASSVIIPRIIAADRTINKTNDDKKTPWDTEVHVLPGVTLTVDASGYTPTTMTIKELNVYPGATVNAANGTLIATTLILRNGWSRLEASKKYDVARLYITPTNGSLSAETAYSDWYIDYDQYYPIAVPWTVTTSGMTYKNTNSAASAGVKMRYYDGASRATNVQTGVGESANWKIFDVDGKAYPATLTPGVGYAMTAKRPAGKAFSIVRMPLTIPDGWTTGGELGYVSSTHKDQVSVTAHAKNDGSTPDYAKGWNFIANPYMSLFKGTLSYAADDNIAYANIPDINFKEYDQVPIDATKALKPSSAFLIQAPKTGTATFATSSRALAAAPSYRNTKADAAMLTQRVYIQLSDEDSEDMMGILVSEKYTAEYELNADLEKLLSDGNTLRTYMRYNNLNMAYLAINEELAKELIPVAVRIPADGDYTFKMHEGSVVNELEGVYLTDYETGKVINLLYNDYTFTAEAGTLSDRFAINAIVGIHTTPTSLDITGVDKDGPTKFIYHDKVFILHNGVIYDSTGKRVNVINK